MERDLLTPAQAAREVTNGGVIAYPTEAVYGLGCDPGNEAAVRRILELKNRQASAGLILIADRFDRFAPFISDVSEEQVRLAQESWPGPVTWLFPRAGQVPDWLAGSHPTVALRVTAHPVCREICEAYQGAIVSTSANPSTEEPARSAERVEEYFGNRIDGIVAGSLGDSAQPSEIRDLATGAILRQG